MQSELEQLQKDVQRFEERQEKEDKVRMGESFGLLVGRLCACSVGQSFGRLFGRSCGLAVFRLTDRSSLHLFSRSSGRLSIGRVVVRSIDRSVVFLWLFGRSVM